MARGTHVYEFEFLLCDAVPIQCEAWLRAGKVYAVKPFFQGQLLDISEYLFDEMNDFITLEQYLIELAQEEYDAPEDEIILELE